MHRRSLQKQHDEEKARHAVHERETLIAQAKEAWKRKQEGSKDGGKPPILDSSRVPFVRSPSCHHREDCLDSACVCCSLRTPLLAYLWTVTSAITCIHYSHQESAFVQRRALSHTHTVYPHLTPSYLILILTFPIVVTDPEDPKFDLEKLLAKWESEAK